MNLRQRKKKSDLLLTEIVSNSAGAKHALQS